MRIKLIFLLFAVLFFADVSDAFCQVPVAKSENKVIIGGKVYYIHRVKPGQTLFSISKAYAIPEAELIRENPGADRVMQVGQALKIPLTATSVTSEEQELAPRPGYLVYEVKEKETAYSISRKHNTTVLEIENANPEIDHTHLSIGQKIYIAQVRQDTVQIEFIYHKVRRRENIYRITRRYNITETELKLYNPELRSSPPQPGQNLKIPVISEKKLVHELPPVREQEMADTVVTDSLFEYDTYPEHIRGPINVAYLIPFDFRPELSDSAGVKSPSVFTRREFENADSQNFLEFFEGSMMAIQDISKGEISLNVHVFDTKRSPDNLRKILNSDGFDKMDLIIGPFHSFNVEIASAFSQAYKIPIVSPFYTGEELTVQNPYLFQVNPSPYTEFDQYARYINSFPDAKVLIIRSFDSVQVENNSWIEYMKQNILHNHDSVFKDLVYQKSNKNFVASIVQALSRTKQNIIFIPENDEVALPLSTIVTQLYYLQKNYRIKLIGMPSWTNFQSIDYSYLHNLEFSFLTPYYFSYDSADVKTFLKNYTGAFYAEPSGYTRKGCPYAFEGYDLTRFFLNTLNEHGRGFFRKIEENDHRGGQLLNDYNFEKISNTGGFENRSLMLVNFLPDLTVSAEKFYP